MSMEMRLFFRHNSSLNIYSLLVTFHCSCSGRAKGEKGAAYQVFELLHNVVITFLFFSRILTPLFCLKLWLVGCFFWGGVAVAAGCEGEASPELF